uniref:Retrotransposon Copia-like N-terminal domain-containing protein n=1 Tax=Opuntia streptacantha TaxID=393608 RepID=A0A7C8YFA1_OPUST
MEVSLIGKNKLQFVHGTIARPDSTNPTMQAQWDRCDNMVLAWLMHAVIKNILDSIMFPATSHDAWMELEQRYGQAHGTRVFEVQLDLCSTSLQSSNFLKSL